MPLFKRKFKQVSSKTNDSYVENKNKESNAHNKLPILTEIPVTDNTYVLEKRPKFPSHLKINPQLEHSQKENKVSPLATEHSQKENKVSPLPAEYSQKENKVSPLAADEHNQVAFSPKEFASFEVKPPENEVKKRDKVYKNNKSGLETSLKNRKKPKRGKNDLNRDRSDKKDSEGSQSSQLSAVQIVLLSQEVKKDGPPENANKRERLEWLQKQRNVGLYVQCDKCSKFRYLADVKDPLDLPKYWFCFISNDTANNHCEVPEEKISAYDEEDMIFNDYNAGSIVWAQIPGYPWWPAMVDDDPDCEQYFWLNTYSPFPTHYNVTFFDSEMVSRAWITPNNLKPFKGNENTFQLKGKDKKYEARVECARRQALEALSYDIATRLEKFSFISRWPYEIKDKELKRKNKKGKPSCKKHEKNDKVSASSHKKNNPKISKKSSIKGITDEMPLTNLATEILEDNESTVSQFSESFPFDMDSF